LPEHLRTVDHQDTHPLSRLSHFFWLEPAHARQPRTGAVGATCSTPSKLYVSGNCMIRSPADATVGSQ
jgi:hypothetical protein